MNIKETYKYIRKNDLKGILFPCIKNSTTKNKNVKNT